MVCAPVRSIIPSLKLGDYLSVQAHKPCSISHLSPTFLSEADHQHVATFSSKQYECVPFYVKQRRKMTFQSSYVTVWGFDFFMNVG